MSVRNTVSEFFARYPQEKIPKGKHLIKATDSNNSVYFLKTGFVRQHSYTKNGEDIVFHVYKPGSFFPIVFTLADQKNKYYFESVTDVVVHKAPQPDVLQFVKDNPDVLFDLTVRLSRGLIGLLEKIEHSSYQNAEMKIYSILDYLANKFGKKTAQGIEITLPLTHTDLASWTGLQRETVSRHMERLKKSSIIDYHTNTIVVLQKDTLHALLE